MRVTGIKTQDIRFPTSKENLGTDAVHVDCDYSATYVTAYTDDNNLKGYGIAFTIGKGNDIVADCIKYFFPLFENMSLDDLEKTIGKQEAVKSIKVDLKDKIITINFIENQILKDNIITQLINDAGYAVRKITNEKK